MNNIQERYNRNLFEMYKLINDCYNNSNTKSEFYTKIKDVMAKYHASFNDYLESFDPKNKPSAPYDSVYFLQLAEYYKEPTKTTLPPSSYFTKLSEKYASETTYHPLNQYDCNKPKERCSIQ